MNMHPESIDIVSFENLEDGETFGIDSTHCTTRYGFYLTTILLIQKTGGTPVMHVISSDEKNIQLIP